MSNEKNQSSWQQPGFALGATSALAVIFFLLFVGVVTERVSFGSGGTRVADTGAAEEPVEINVRKIDKNDWMYGDPKAKVSIVEYSDMECPFCKRYHETLKTIVDEYDGQVNWVYRHLPLQGLHKKALPEAIASECVGKLGGNKAFWAFTNKVYADTPANDGFNLEELGAYAASAGVDQAAFQECYDNNETKDLVAEDMQDAANNDFNGTPASVIVAGKKQIPVQGAVGADQLRTLLSEFVK